MSKRIETFADLIAPIDEETFFAEYHDRKYLHIKAPSPDKLDDVMNWEKLSAILGMTAIWSASNLKLVLDTKHIPVEQYCRPVIDRNHQKVMQPDADKVKSWLRCGASLVANDIDTLLPGMAAAADALEARLGGKVQSNLYCSWHQHQAFPTHFDTHEVYALHVAGEKVWRIYEGRLDNPIANDAYKNLDDDFHKAKRGAVAEEVTLRPGDLLYIPRGQYHDALASSEGCIHLAYGVTHIIGYDVMTTLFEHALGDRVFRTNMPFREAGPDALKSWLSEMLDAFTAVGRSDEFLALVDGMRDGFHYHRGQFDLPGDALQSDSGERFGIAIKSVKVVRKGPQALLESARGSVPIPDAVVAPVSWIVAQEQFSGDELASAFPQIDDAGRAKLIQDLTSMRVIAPL
jgi:ribosomal protein L16 Arg81 hydroxylase